MVTIEQSQQTFGQIAKLGFQDTFATMETKIVTINQHQEAAEQERKAERAVMIDQKSLNNYVKKY